MREHENANLIQLNKNSLLNVSRRFTFVLSLFVILGVFWSLKLTGITLAGEAFCGKAEHKHSEACLVGKLICEQEETAEHIHDENCVLKTLVCESEETMAHVHDESCLQKKLSCTETEQEAHVHDDSCYPIVQVCTEESEDHVHGEECFTVSNEADFICDREETEGHVHSEDCYILLEDSFICGVDNTEGHVHTEKCYQVESEYLCELTGSETDSESGETNPNAHVHTQECYEILEKCPLEEHVHIASCYSNINADLETQEIWEESLRNVTEEFSTAQTLVSVARSQLGYTESTLNFEVDLHDVRRGITRYGQWYGNPYGDWSAMFVSFCLHYAGAEDLPANAGAESMRLEWEAAGLYESAETAVPEVGNLIFLKSNPAEPLEEKITSVENEEYDSESLDLGLTEGASEVAIISDVTEDTITVIQGNLNDMVAERTISVDDSLIIGYGLVPNQSPFALMAVPAGDLSYLAKTINYDANMFTDGRSFVIYAEFNGQHYALISRPVSGMEATVEAVPIEIDSDGNIYAGVDTPDSLLWNFSQNGNNRNQYYIQNAATGRYLHPGGDNAVIYGSNWPTALQASGTGAKLVHTSNNNDVGIRFNGNQLRFETARKNSATTLYFGVSERCTVWLDGTNGGVSSSGGSQNQSYSVSAGSQMTLPTQWLSPSKYSYRLKGWYDVTHDQYYAPGEEVTITENTVFYADWIADTYDIGEYNAYVANTVSTNSFVTTQLFDYNYLFNVLSADTTGNISNKEHSETWSIVQNENVDYENRESMNFIFLDYGDSGTIEYPNNRQDGVNAYPGDGIVTSGIYTSDIGDALFTVGDHIPGKTYLGTADHLFQIMTDSNDPHYGYYYYDSAKNAASYNQSANRFYVYDYLEATSAELSAAKSDFLPLNSPYANSNGKNLGTYTPNGEYAKLTNYVYDAKFSDSDNKVQSNYAFGMKIDIRFYLPNKPGEDGNNDIYGNDLCFEFSGDDDLWVLVDGKLALDIGGIHQAESGQINFATGEVLVQGNRNNALSNVVSALEPGEHTLTVMYLERGGSHSNCAIYFNLAPRYQFGIQKEDVLTREVLNGAQFSVFHDLECTIPAELWESQESYISGDPATNVFTVKNGSAHMWGMGAGNTYYIKETRPPDDAEYGFPNGIIRMVLDKKGAATYSVMIVDGGDGISGGFTVHGFRVDEETQEAYIIATNAPKWVKDVTSVQARKYWQDNLDHSADSVTVYLTIHDPNGTVRRLQEAQLNEETDWQHLWDNLPKYYEDGTLIQYGVEEAYVPGYYSAVEKVDKYSTSISKWTATTTLENGKTYLLRTSNGFLSTQNRNSDTGFIWVNESTAQQSDLARWVITKSGNTYKLTNEAGQTITFYYNNGSPTDFYAYDGGESNQSKQYFSSSVTNGQIRLYYDPSNSSTNYYIHKNMNNSSKFQYSTGTNNAMLFTPMVQTQSSTTETVDGEVAYKITNSPLSTETALTVRKEWHNHLGDDKSLYEQAQVTVKLFANGKDTGRTVTLSLKNDWTDTFRGLPYKDSNGDVIQYSIEESWTNDDWLAEYGPINSSGGTVPTYNTTLTNIYRWGRGVELPSTGTSARSLFILCGSSIMLFSLVYGFVARCKRERRGQ